MTHTPQPFEMSPEEQVPTGIPMLDAWRRERDQQAAAEILARYSGFIGSVATQYIPGLKVRGGTVDTDDIKQRCRIALFNAVEKYQPGHGADFFSYAEPGIRHVAYEEFYRNQGAVYVKPTAHKAITIVEVIERERLRRGGPKLTDQEIAKALSNPPDDIVESKGPAVVGPQAPYNARSVRLWGGLIYAGSLETIDEAHKDRGLAERAIIISSDPTTVMPEEAFEKHERFRAIGQLFIEVFQPRKGLEEETARQQYVLMQRLGFFTASGKPPTFREIGLLINLSGKRADQIYKAALKKLQTYIVEHDINEQNFTEALAKR